jgi:hypothetical protein
VCTGGYSIGIGLSLKLCNFHKSCIGRLSMDNCIDRIRSLRCTPKLTKSMFFLRTSHRCKRIAVELPPFRLSTWALLDFRTFGSFQERKAQELVVLVARVFLVLVTNMELLLFLVLGLLQVLVLGMFQVLELVVLVLTMVLSLDTLAVKEMMVVQVKELDK